MIKKVQPRKKRRKTNKKPRRKRICKRKNNVSVKSNRVMTI